MASNPETTPVSAALDRAEGALRVAEVRAGGPDAMLTRETCAIAIAAFLRALPEGTTIAVADGGERRIRLAREMADAIR